MRSILTGNNLEYQHKYGKIFQILGFYVILYNISNFSFGVNFPFKIILITNMNINAEVNSQLSKFFICSFSRTWQLYSEIFAS